MKDQQLRIGFIGLGIMGLPMAGNILKAGYPLTVYNRTPSKAGPLVAEGARLAGNPAEAAAASDVVIVIVSDSPDVEQVVVGSQGVLEGIRPGSVVIDMSTVSPETERQIGARLSEKGCHFLDAPVSGGDVGARNATLAIMVGGDAQVFERVKPVLGAMGKTITHCGPVGHGQLTKLSNQVLVAVTLLGVCEAIHFARRSGLDPEVMIEAVKNGAAGSWQLANLGARIVQGDYAPGFMVDLMVKDLRLVEETADRVGIPLQATAQVTRLFRRLQSSGAGRDGTQSLARVVADTESN